MAAIQADIKPQGIQQKDLVNLIYMILTSFRGIAAKLDADGSVTDTDYLANLDALFNLVIDDCRGNHLNMANDESSVLTPAFNISPQGFAREHFTNLLYMIFNGWETLCEQLDADTNPPTNTTYEAVAYTAIYTALVENSQGNILGNGVSFVFRSGAWPEEQVLDILYDIVNGIQIFCAQADTDAAPADSNYEALWYTANITLTIENNSGSRIGN